MHFQTEAAFLNMCNLFTNITHLTINNYYFINFRWTPLQNLELDLHTLQLQQLSFDLPNFLRWEIRLRKNETEHHVNVDVLFTGQNMGERDSFYRKGHRFSHGKFEMIDRNIMDMLNHQEIKFKAISIRINHLDRLCLFDTDTPSPQILEIPPLQ